MDDEKRPSKRLVKKLSYASLALGFLVCAYALIIFFQTQNIPDPKKCLTTSMFKIDLCPSNPDYVRYKQVPKHFFQALVLSEDAAFWSHSGFDWYEIKESFRRNFLEWRFARGGSTLTQQLAKNMYLTQEKSLQRKFKEIFISKQIESQLTKSQILEKYVNIVELGKNIYGLTKASAYYFAKAPGELNVLESVFLVSLLPSPKRLGKSFTNKKLSEKNVWRMKVILRRMYATKKISDETYTYIGILIESEPWPFNEFNEFAIPMLDNEDGEIEEELFEELDDVEEDVEETGEAEEAGEENEETQEVQIDDVEETEEVEVN